MPNDGCGDESEFELLDSREDLLHDDDDGWMHDVGILSGI